MANRLFVEEIDEVSSVDRPANQHGLIAIAKRAGDDMDEYFDAEGNPVDIDEVQLGEEVFSADGSRYVMASDEEINDLVEQGLLDPQDVVDVEEPDGEHDNAAEGELVGAVGKRESLGATLARGRGAPAVSGGNRSARAVRGGRREDLGEPRRGRVGKSAGQTILEELRKSMTDAERDQVLARAFDAIDDANERAARAETLAKRLEAQQEGNRYREIAKSFDGVPVEVDELGGILQAVSGVLSKRQLDTFERILEAGSEGSKLYDELGYNGTSSGSGVHDEVSAYALEVVGKSGGLTVEQAVTELYSANPAAYDEYCAEQR